MIVSMTVGVVAEVVVVVMTKNKHSGMCSTQDCYHYSRIKS